MRRPARLLVVSMFGATVLAVATLPAAAYHEDWGFSYISNESAPPGTVVRFGIKRQISHDVPYSETEPQPIRIADEMCDDGGGQLLDDRGRVVAAETLEYREDFGLTVINPVIIPEGTAPGTYYLKETCDYGTGEPDPSGLDRDWSDPVYQLPEGLHSETDCVRFEVTAPGTPLGPEFFVYRGGGPLRRDACPLTTWGVIGRGLGATRVRLGGAFEHFVGRVLPASVPTAETTTTTGPRGTPTPAPTPAPQPATPVPAGDTTPPVISGLGLIMNSCVNNSVGVQVNASDNVGVTSVSYSWTFSGGGGGGPGTMSGGPSTFTATITGGPGIGQSITVSATARDAAGNTTGAQTTRQCPSSP